MSEGLIIAVISVMGSFIAALIGAFGTIASTERRGKGVSEIGCGTLGLMASIGGGIGLLIGLVIGLIVVQIISPDSTTTVEIPLSESSPTDNKSDQTEIFSTQTAHPTQSINSTTYSFNCYGDNNGTPINCDLILDPWSSANLTSSDIQQNLIEWSQNCSYPIPIDVVRDSTGLSLIIGGGVTESCVDSLASITNANRNWVGYVTPNLELYNCHQSNALRIHFYNFNSSGFVQDCR